MKNTFINIKEASNITGKAEITIRRFVREYTSDKSKDQSMIIRDDKGTYLINIDLIKENFKTNQKNEEYREVENILRNQINFLTDQIDKKDNQIEGLQNVIKGQTEFLEEAQQKINLLETKQEEKKKKWWQF